MWRLAVLLCLTVVAAQADPNVLSGGVFIVHSPPEFDWSCANQYGICDSYDICGFGIQSCDQQNPQIPSSAATVWYVIAAWHEAKSWCGVEFGIGAYDANGTYVIEYDACPHEALSIPYGAWPAPNTGVSIASAGVPWDGNFRPVYWFVTYAYYAGQLPLTAHPGTGFGGFASCSTPPVLFAAECFGSLGLLEPGVPCCPPEPELHVCCVGVECVLVEGGDDCNALGGIWHPEWDTCNPDPCAPWMICCVGHECILTWEDECENLGGTWHPEFSGCGPPNPCDIYTPAEPSSWGAIKAVYR